MKPSGREVRADRQAEAAGATHGAEGDGGLVSHWEGGRWAVFSGQYSEAGSQVNTEHSRKTSSDIAKRG
jgi:hypothetical protein